MFERLYKQLREAFGGGPDLRDIAGSRVEGKGRGGKGAGGHGESWKLRGMMKDTVILFIKGRLCHLQYRNPEPPRKQDECPSLSEKERKGR